MSFKRTVIGTMELSHDIRAGRMLAAGRLTITLTSKRSGEHLSLEFKTKIRNPSQVGPRWKDTNWNGAIAAGRNGMLFINSAGGDRIATYFPDSGTLSYDEQRADLARVKSAVHVLHALSGQVEAKVREQGDGMDYTEEIETVWFTMVPSHYCGKCGRELTDPVSIRRGLGPTCYGAQTGSVHQAKQRVEEPRRDVQRDLSRVVTRPQDVAALAQVVEELPRPKADKAGRAVPTNFEELASRVTGEKKRSLGGRSTRRPPASEHFMLAAYIPREGIR